jgi:formate dehydrogenase maturation protein FdhE
LDASATGRELTEVHDLSMRTRKPKLRAKGSRNEESSRSAVNDLDEVVDLLVESRIRIDALEQILVKTNAVAYDLYLDTIEKLRAQETAEVKRLLTLMLESKPTET